MLAVFSDPPVKGQSRAKRIGQVEKGGRKRGIATVGPKCVTEGKEWGTQGGCYAKLMMRESEGEEAVHAYSITAHGLYKGAMENL